MDGDQKFWVLVWSLAAAVVCAAILAIGGTSAYDSYLLRQMVAEQHVDPMRAACALNIGDTSRACSILAAQPH